MCLECQPPSLFCLLPMNSLKSLQLPIISPGLNIVFVDPNLDYVCISCKVHFCRPYQLQCGHRICSECFSEITESCSYYPCPSGDIDCEESTVSEIRCDYSVLRELSQKQVFCTNQKDGCEKIMLLKNLKNHLEDECLFALVECPYSCGVVVIRRSELDNHKTNCPKRPYYCSFRNLGCSFKGSPSDLRNHMKDQRMHLDCAAIKLKELEVENVNLIRKQEDLSHRYSSIAELFMRLRADSDEKLQQASSLITRITCNEHEISKRLEFLERTKNNDKEYRRQDVWKEVEKQDKMLEIHQEKLKSLGLALQCVGTTNYNGVLIWKVNEFSKRLQAAKEGRSLSIYSQPFYTNRYGYKMCARVYLNGDGAGKNSHISLFFVVMQGEYDNILSWPFRNRVTLMLLDQKNLSNNVTDSFMPDPRSSSFEKPSCEMNIASGNPKFISHAEVMKGDTYLKNDVLFFKVVVSDT